MMSQYKNLNSLYDHLKTSKKESYRKIAALYKTSATSILRKIKLIKSRSHIKGAEFFESEDGQRWLVKLVIAVIMIFGITCNMGLSKCKKLMREKCKFNAYYTQLYISCIKKLVLYPN